MHRFTPRRGAFTLIEVLVVVIILGVLAAIVMPSVVGHVDEARAVRAQADLRHLDTAVRLFRKDVGRYPTQTEGLDALAQAPPDVENWRGYLESGAELPRDPWGNQYRYFADPGGPEPFEIVCYGADGEPGGEGYSADLSSKWRDQ
jgi:general secretion pathway protein G